MAEINGEQQPLFNDTIINISGDDVSNIIENLHGEQDNDKRNFQDNDKKPRDDGKTNKPDGILNISNKSLRMDKSNICPHCNKSYARIKNLENHIMREHKTEPKIETEIKPEIKPEKLKIHDDLMTELVNKFEEKEKEKPVIAEKIDNGNIFTTFVFQILLIATSFIDRTYEALETLVLHIGLDKEKEYKNEITCVLNEFGVLSYGSGVMSHKINLLYMYATDIIEIANEAPIKKEERRKKYGVVKPIKEPIKEPEKQTEPAEKKTDLNTNSILFN